MHTFTVNHQDDGSVIYSVGYWCPAIYNKKACWEPLRDCYSSAEAAYWVSYLNGGSAREVSW